MEPSEPNEAWDAIALSSSLQEFFMFETDFAPGEDPTLPCLPPFCPVTNYRSRSGVLGITAETQTSPVSISPISMSPVPMSRAVSTCSTDPNLYNTETHSHDWSNDHDELSQQYDSEPPTTASVPMKRPLAARDEKEDSFRRRVKNYHNLEGPSVAQADSPNINTQSPKRHSASFSGDEIAISRQELPEQNYTCTFCERSFVDESVLRRHQKTVHLNTRIDSPDIKSYRCSFKNCKKSRKIWNRLDNLKEHLRRVHGSQDAEIKDLLASAEDVGISQRPKHIYRHTLLLRHARKQDLCSLQPPSGASLIKFKVAEQPKAPVTADTEENGRDEVRTFDNSDRNFNATLLSESAVQEFLELAPFKDATSDQPFSQDTIYRSTSQISMHDCVPELFDS